LSQHVRQFVSVGSSLLGRSGTREREKKVDSVIANRVAAALWMKIAQRAPLRINNLMKTDIQANILRSHTGKDAAVALY
jgi:hypothetical protein